MKDRRTVLTIIALLVTLGCAGLLLSKVQNEIASLRHFAGYEIVWWTLVALLLVYVRWVERRPLTSIGFRKPGIWSILIGIAAGVVLLAGLVGIYYVILPALHFKEDPRVTQVMNQMLAKPHWWRLTLILRGAVAEEILFRGYAIERLRDLTGSVRIAGIISCTVFALEHLGYRNGFPKEGFIFTGSKIGRPLDLHNLANRVIRPALNDAKIPWCGWHGFRRGLATNLHTLGVPDTDVQRLLRHANVRVTQDSYIKVETGVKKAAMNKLQKALSAKRRSRKRR